MVSFSKSNSALPWLRLFCTYTLSVLHFLPQAECQYIVETEFPADGGNSYCQWHCLSNLSSIHSEGNYLQIQSLSNADPGDGIWIGMRADPHPDYKWTDGSTITFGGDLSGGSGPWSAGEPSGSGTQCVAMATRFEWIATDCSTPRRSLCNHCNGIINKYRLLYLDVEGTGYSYTQAQSACSSLVDRQSSLAAIHSDRDWREASTLCSISGSDCWIGLNDRNSEGVYSYTDGSSFDYGTITEDPLSSTIPADTDCVHLSSSNGYVFEDTYCSGSYSVNYALCHLPSELCDDNAVWTKLTGNVDGDCIKTLTEETLTYVADRLWYNGPSTLVIEYQYSFSTTDVRSEADSGIVLYNGKEGSTCRSYYIFVRKEAASTTSYSVNLEHTDSGTTPQLLSSVPCAFEEKKVYLLSVHVSSTGNVFEIYLNDVLYIYYDHSSNRYTRGDGYSGFIAIKTSLYTETTALNLYISGPRWSQNSKNELDIIPSSSCPTNAPTATTRSPSRAPPVLPSLPTDAPTRKPSTVPTLSPIITANPSRSPSQIPSTSPSRVPSKAPTTKRPTGFPTQRPTYEPTPKPSTMPTRLPSTTPTRSPSMIPSRSPSQMPSRTPSAFPTKSPSRMPTKHPTDGPTRYPTTSSPTPMPSLSPTLRPTASPSTSPPTTEPTVEPTIPSQAPSSIPTSSPTVNPTLIPSPFPTVIPSSFPSGSPSRSPSAVPSPSPSLAPTQHVRIAEIIEYDTVVLVRGDTVSITVTFQYRFVAVDVTAIELILEESVHELVKADCGYTKGLQFDHQWGERETAFNASITTCAPSAESRLLSSMDDESLQSKWMQRILQETEIQIVDGQTDIDYGATTSQPGGVPGDVVDGEIVEAVKEEIFEDDSWTSWLVRILLLQVLLCCVLVACVCTLRLKTKTLVEKTKSVREEIEQQIESSEIGGAPLEGNLQASVNPIFNGVPPGSPAYHYATANGVTQPFHILRPPLSAQTLPHTQSPQMRAVMGNTTTALQRAISQPHPALTMTLKEDGDFAGHTSSPHLWKQMKSVGKMGMRRSGKYRTSNKMVEMMHHFGDIQNIQKTNRFSKSFGSTYHQAVSTEDFHVSVPARDRGGSFRRIRTDNSYPSIPDTQTIVSSFKYIKPSRRGTPDVSLTMDDGHGDGHNTQDTGSGMSSAEEKEEPIPSASPPPHALHQNDQFHTAPILAHRMPAFTDSYNPSATYNLMPQKSVSPSPITKPSKFRGAPTASSREPSPPSATTVHSGSSTPRESTALSTQSEVTTALQSEVTTAISNSPTPIIVYRKSVPTTPRSGAGDKGGRERMPKAKKILSVTPRISRSTQAAKSDGGRSSRRKMHQNKQSSKWMSSAISHSAMSEVEKSEFTAEENDEDDDDEAEPLKM